MATPPHVLASIPDALLARSGKPARDATNAQRLLDWLEARGCRPSFMEIESERQHRQVSEPATVEGKQHGPVLQQCVTARGPTRLSEYGRGLRLHYLVPMKGSTMTDQPIPRPAPGKPPTAPDVAGSPWLTPAPQPDETPPQAAA